MAKEIKQGDKIEIRGFSSFVIKEYKAYAVRAMKNVMKRNTIEQKTWNYGR